MKYLSLLFALLFISSCMNVPEVEQSVVQKRFFDLKEYFNKEINRLSGQNSFTKIAYYNDKQEKKEQRNIDLSQELIVFSNADINRAAWLDKYSADTTFTDDKKVKSLNYEALDESLKTRSIYVEFSGSSVAVIKIITDANSPIAGANSILTYRPEKGYSIESKQDVVLLDENEVKIEVIY